MSANSAARWGKTRGEREPVLSALHCRSGDLQRQRCTVRFLCDSWMGTVCSVRGPSLAVENCPFRTRPSSELESQSHRVQACAAGS